MHRLTVMHRLTAARVLRSYRATAVDPVPDEGTPAYDMLVLVMKWWAFALASTGVATGIVAQNCDAKTNRLYIRTMSVFSGVGGLALTYANPSSRRR